MKKKWVVSSSLIPLETEPLFPKRLPSLDVIEHSDSVRLHQDTIQNCSFIEMNVAQVVELQNILEEWLLSKNVIQYRSNKKRRAKRTA